MNEKRSHIRCDWSPDIWSWSPLEGRWSPEHGRPDKPVYLEISTRDVGYRQGYDFWRETVFYAFDADRQRDRETPGFRAAVSGLVSVSAEFYTYRSDAVSGGRTQRQINADNCRDIDLGLVLAGERRHSDTVGNSGTTCAGEFYLYDAALPSRVEWGAHQGIHMTLRREAVETALGGPLSSVGRIAELLESSRMGTLLKQQLQLMAQHIHVLASDERAFLLEQATELALYSLSRIRGLMEMPHDGGHAGLYVAARRIIEARYADADLTPSRIASILGVSRASLYRAFSGHEHSVSDAIRDVRLNRALALLRFAQHLSVNDIALRCGFTHVRSFQRAFRVRFEMTPGEARETWICRE